MTMVHTGQETSNHNQRELMVIWRVVDRPRIEISLEGTVGEGSRSMSGGGCTTKVGKKKSGRELYLVFACGCVGIGCHWWNDEIGRSTGALCDILDQSDTRIEWEISHIRN